MLIIACNTASAYALDALRLKADFPIYGVIDAGVEATKKALLDKNKKNFSYCHKGNNSVKRISKSFAKTRF